MSNEYFSSNNKSPTEPSCENPNTDNNVQCYNQMKTFFDESVNFEDFFVRVCELKTLIPSQNLKVLMEVVESYRDTYDSVSITYLKDCILTEIVLPCRNIREREMREKDYQKYIFNHFEEIFPNWSLVLAETSIGAIGRIDLLAKDKGNGKHVIIELKIGHKNPTQQLISYATQFVDPILVGITEDELPSKMRLPNIKYFTYSQLGVDKYKVAIA